MDKKRTLNDLQAEIKELKAQLEDAREELRAIRENEVDALVVSGADGPQVFTLQGADQPYRVFIESMNEGAVTMSPDGTILHCNSRFADMLGRPLHNIMGASFFDLLADKEGPGLQGMVRSCDMEGYKGEFLLGTDGKSIPVQLSARPLTKEMDTFCVVITDLTELARAEKALQKANEELEMRVEERTHELAESRERYRATVASIGDAVIVTDTAGMITNMNAVAENLTGWVMDEARGRPVNEVFHIVNEFTREEVESPVAKVLREGVIVGLANHTVLIRKDGTEIPIDDSGAPIHDGGKVSSGVVMVFRDITERRQAEETVQTALLRLYAVLSGMYAGLLLVASDDRIEYANQAFCDLFELDDPPKSLVGLTPPEIFAKISPVYLHPEKEVPRVREIVGQAEPVRGEEVLLRGGRVYLRDFIPILINGKSYGRLWHHTDITEWKKAEQAKRESEMMFHSLFESSPDAILLTVPDGSIIEANPAACAMFGMSKEELRRKRREALTDPDDPRHLTALEEGRRTGRFVSGELNYVRANGERFPAEVDSVILPGDPPKSFVILRDITERKKAEKALRRSRDELELRVRERTAELETERARLRDMLEMLPVMVLLLKPDHGVAYANRAFKKKFGEPQGRKCFNYLFGKKEPCDFCEAYSVLETGMPHHWECKLADGGVVDVYNAPFTDVDGSPLVLEVDIDITEQRQLEEHLRQAQKMEALGTLTGGVAHDFNNILAAILGFTEMSLDDVPPKSLLEKNLRNILKSSLRARDLIKQMLTFSRRSEYELKAMPITPLVKETARLLRASIPTTVRINVDTFAMSDVVEANATGIQQILMNLATNAAHAMRDTGGKLTITLSDAEIGSEPDRAGLLPGPYLKLTVSDTGVGMDETVRKRIFEPFFTTKVPGEGTGMGLSVVYGIVKNLKGEIEVESVPGKGSTFHVLIPKVAAGEETVILSGKEALGGTECILFIDDEDVLVELGGAMLEKLGYRVIALTDSTQALKIFSDDPSAFHLIITDQTMPGLTGVRLAKEVLKIRPEIPIVLCTGYSESINLDTVKAAGIRDLLMKPLARKELGEAVRRTLDKKNEP